MPINFPGPLPPGPSSSGASIAPNLRAGYCSLLDVTERLGSATAQQANGLPSNATRDSLINDLIVSLSRRFDDETERNLGCFTPLFETRIYSGRGSQIIEVDEFATLAKVEQNATPTASAATWQDVTSEFNTQRMAYLPVRFWPKNRIFRSQAFMVDTYRIGNIRVSGIFGNVQPDMMLTPPTTPWVSAPYLTQAQINAISPDGLGNGWWSTPDQVRKAIAEWAVYTFQAGRAQYSDTSGSTGATNVVYRKGIPPEVQMVIDKYRAGDIKLALITLDGVDIRDERVYPGDPDAPSRWAGWM